MASLDGDVRSSIVGNILPETPSFHAPKPFHDYNNTPVRARPQVWNKVILVRLSGHHGFLRN
jgi:hypothetical protein